jgi:hypothetical protein
MQFNISVCLTKFNGILRLVFSSTGLCNHEGINHGASEAGNSYSSPRKILAAHIDTQFKSVSRTLHPTTSITNQITFSLPLLSKTFRYICIQMCVCVCVCVLWDELFTLVFLKGSESETEH